MGSNTSDLTVKYKYIDGIITANLTGLEHEYYQKVSKAYKQDLQKNSYCK